jgi:hypothetical protein
VSQLTAKVQTQTARQCVAGVYAAPYSVFAPAYAG